MPEFRYIVVRDLEGWEQVRAIRHEVYVVEQSIPDALEWDDFDRSSEHRLLLEAELPVACARWRWTDVGVAKLERFAVRVSARGRGVGRRLVQEVVEETILLGARRLELSAQAHLATFYGSFGFDVCGEGYDEAGIPHLPMRRELPRCD